jgi:hypothetical protein
LNLLQAEEKLKIERGELEPSSDMKGTLSSTIISVAFVTISFITASKKKPSKDVVPTSSNSPESPKARSATQPEKQ